MQNNKIIFSGDSFTWGQGLQYYGGFSDIKIMPGNQYIRSYLTDEHISYIKENRYAKLVSRYFNYVEIVKPDNGGSDDESIKFIYGNINDDVKVVILQTTQPARSNYNYYYKNEERIICGSALHLDDNPESKMFREYLIENNVDVDDWYMDLKKQIIKKIKDLATFLESKSIKFIILPWTNDYIQNFRNEPTLVEYLLKINYKNFTYSSIQSLMDMNQEFFIKSDYKKLGLNPPPDHHMSLDCHKLIAEMIIDKLKENITN